MLLDMRKVGEGNIIRYATGEETDVPAFDDTSSPNRFDNIQIRGEGDVEELDSDVLSEITRQFQKLYSFKSLVFLY